MIIQQVRRNARLPRAVLLAAEILVLVFCMIFFALLIEYTETAFRIVPLRAVQLAVSALLAVGIHRLRGMLAAAYEYRFERTRLSVYDVRRPQHPQPLWNLDPDGLLDWGHVGDATFRALLEDDRLVRHDFFVHRGASLGYIHYRMGGEEGLTVIELQMSILELLREIAPGRERPGSTPDRDAPRANG